ASSPELTSEPLSTEPSLSSIPQSESTDSSNTLTTESSVTTSTPDSAATADDPAPRAATPPTTPRRKMTKSLPGRGARDAPEFDGRALNLTRYWEDIEEVATSMERTTDDEKIRLALRYVSRETEVLWKGVMTPQTTTWAAFKAVIAELYPGSDGAKMFTLKDLDNFLAEQALITIKTKEDFSAYHRRFKTLTVHLIAATKMTLLDEKKLYPKGLEKRFCNRVYTRLQIVKPNHPGDDPYDIDDFVAAAKYILDLPSMVDDGGGDTAFIKKEMVDLSDAFQKLNTQFKVEMQSLHSVVRPSQGYPQPQQYQPNLQGQGQQQMGQSMYAPGECVFCSSQHHYLRECPVLMEYIRQGRCLRNNDNKIMEDPALLQAVIDRAMATTVTISNRELCAISPEVRKYYRENMITKRIPTVETSMVMVEEGEPMQEALVLRWEHTPARDHILTASPINSLCILDVLVNNTHMIACTLDQGSEIVAMNRVVWQELGVTLSPDKTLTMESADSNQSTTAGVIKNLKFSIGDIDILLQVHVVDGAPFDILMGRPFFRFTECHTRDRADGTQELTLTCPNTGKTVQVAT
ncbi:hypothetical protein FB451DRAFT_946042, partial [Mycena latifolia]